LLQWHIWKNLFLLAMILASPDVLSLDDAIKMVSDAGFWNIIHSEQKHC